MMMTSCFELKGVCDGQSLCHWPGYVTKGYGPYVCVGSNDSGPRWFTSPHFKPVVEPWTTPPST